MPFLTSLTLHICKNLQHNLFCIEKFSCTLYYQFFFCLMNKIYFQHVLQMKMELDKLMKLCTYWAVSVEENYSIAFISHLDFFLVTFDHVQFFTKSGFESLTLCLVKQRSFLLCQELKIEEQVGCLGSKISKYSNVYQSLCLMISAKSEQLSSEYKSW